MSAGSTLMSGRDIAPGGRDRDVAEVDLVARPRLRLRDMQFERRSIAALRRFQHS
jgi:hypothetical protein